MLPSGAQDEEDYRAVHALNPLRRGVEVDDVVRAVRFLVEQPAMTGETLIIDGGQQQMALPRDVQFLERNDIRLVPINHSSNPRGIDSAIHADTRVNVISH